MTEYEHQRDVAEGAAGAAHLGFLAHEMRNLLNTSMLTFSALTRGNVGVNGNTGALLGRSLQRMRVLIDRTLTEVRIDADTQKVQRVSVAALIEEIEIVALIEAKSRDIQLSIDAGPFDVAVEGDQQILASVVANLVQNAFKFTRPCGHIRIRAHTVEERVLIDVRDECGGLPPGRTIDLFLPFEQRGVDQSGMGLGLAISLQGCAPTGERSTSAICPGTGVYFSRSAAGPAADGRPCRKRLMGNTRTYQFRPPLRWLYPISPVGCQHWLVPLSIINIDRPKGRSPYGIGSCSRFVGLRG